MFNLQCKEQGNKSQDVGTYAQSAWNQASRMLNLPEVKVWNKESRMLSPLKLREYEESTIIL
jgi:hypothetical protein